MPMQCVNLLTRLLCPARYCNSVIGPLLFFLYINNLPALLQTMPTLFADDIALVIAKPSHPKIECMTEFELKGVPGWM